MNRESQNILGASFRDPAGHLFRHNNILYRQINESYQADYTLLMRSGLYQHLVDRGLLVPHRELAPEQSPVPDAWAVIAPEELSWISYPWEWCFTQLQDAALATLDIQLAALEYGMVLKDASAFNTQFHQGHPTLIDTLSFTRYREGEPWVAYRQFCQHFLAPLVLLHYRDYRLLKLLRSYIDGIPLDLTSSLLPLRSWLRYSLLAHIHLHARAQLHYADAADTRTNHKKPRVSALGMRAMIEGLKNLVARLRPHARESEWDHYYLDTNYEDAAMVSKEGLVSRFLDSDQTTGAILLDLGANTGRFSRLGLAFGYQVIAMDIDENAVEACYRAVRDSNPDSDSHSAGANMLPLVQDLSNPTPALGWAHEERMSLQQRGPVHTVMALALIHHLAIANNVPLQRCAEYFASLGDRLIIEFVPKTDSQVERLLSTREDIFSDYTQAGFERAFGVFFEISQAADIPGSERRIYYFRRRGLAAAIS